MNIFRTCKRVIEEIVIPNVGYIVLSLFIVFMAISHSNLQERVAELELIAKYHTMMLDEKVARSDYIKLLEELARRLDGVEV